MLRATVNPQNPDNTIMAKAGEILRNGGLVAFPTETVYGLGADAFNEKAVSKIYKIKGRPADNPLILHANHFVDFDGLLDLTDGLRDTVQKLVATFCPGPFTMVLPTKDKKTVAIRVPEHPVARALIAHSGCIIAAPSANLSGRPSPTHASHVSHDFHDNQIDMLIDGGATQNGLESTVITFDKSEKPVLLRPGAVTVEEIKSVIGDICEPSQIDNTEAPLSPGMKYRHYAPKTPLILLIGTADAVDTKITELQGNYKAIKILRTFDRTHEEVARELFFHLREFDKKSPELIIAEGVDETGIGLAIMNRLKKAAAEVIYL